MNNALTTTSSPQRKWLGRLVALTTLNLTITAGMAMAGFAFVGTPGAILMLTIFLPIDAYAFYSHWRYDR